MAEVQGVTPVPKPPLKPEDERMYAMLTHLLGFAGVIGIPMGHIVGPLVVWLLKRDESELVNQCGKAALNFQLSMTIYFVVSAFLTLVFIGWIGLLVLGILWLVNVIQASIAGNAGRSFSYPLSITFFS